MIILEGPDGSGKSTLAKNLSHNLNLPVHHFGPPPKNRMEFDIRLQFMFNNHDKYIFDRIPLISEVVYNIMRGTTFFKDHHEMELLLAQLRGLKPLIIYCNTEILKPITKSHDTKEHSNKATRWAYTLKERYEAIMESGLMPEVIRYDYTKHSVNYVLERIERRKKMEETVTNPIQDVRDFQSFVLNNQFPSKPIMLTSTKLNQQVEKLEEELEELVEAKTIADQADALIDLIYLSYGALHQMGVDTKRVWDAVQKANMSKRFGVTKRGHDNDACKPEGWQAPDHSWLDQATGE